MNGHISSIMDQIHYVHASSWGNIFHTILDVVEIGRAHNLSVGRSSLKYIKTIVLDAVSTR
jgi:hypothetical protein